MKAWIVVATWVWWTAIVGPAWVCSLTVQDKHTTFDYNLVGFTTGGATKKSYMRFTEALRGQLASGNERYEIPLLRSASTVTGSQRFLLVELSNWADLSVTLALDVSNAHVVAYQGGENRSYFFPNAPGSAVSNLFTNTRQTKLPFSSNYNEIESVAGEARAEIDLGILELEDSISSLYRTSTIKRKELAHAIIVIAQLVSEAVRFRYIEQLVRSSIKSQGTYQSFRPDASMLSLENSWTALSTAIQNSNRGVFSMPIRLQRSDSSILIVDSVTRTLIANLALMVFICRDQASQFSPLIRSFVDNDDIYCEIPEPTILISGPNGRCVDVKDGKYNNGNPIILWSCNSPATVNQLWTLKRDGTIRSNGKCLTTYGYNAGSYMMIYDCNTAAAPATRWELWTNGSIINPHSTLALNAESGNGGTTLTADENTYATAQGWLASNNTEPFVTSIVGLMDLCMHGNQSSVWLEECVSNKAEQKWAFYSDGSIRPQQNKETCLTSSTDVQGANVIIVSCSAGRSSQRWVFRNDGTILNLANGFVMDVRGSDPTYKQIIVYKFHGDPNQKWYSVL